MALVVYLIISVAFFLFVDRLFIRAKGGNMRTTNCEHCHQTKPGCLCDQVDQYFQENGHLMAEKQEKAPPKGQFFYFEPGMIGRIPGVQ